MPDSKTRVMTDLQEGFDDVSRGLARMARHLGEDGSEAVSDATRAFMQTAADHAEQIQKQSGRLARRAETKARQNPVTSAAIAAAAIGLMGFVFMMSRNGRD